ncbi:hypothetical protein DITRI_Ditri08aG0090300 [Diplodiscus trichospermus]
MKSDYFADRWCVLDKLISNLIKWREFLELLQPFISSVNQCTTDWDVLENSTSTSPSLLSIRWQPPTTGFVKINVDAGVRLTTGEACLGVVTRDSAGEVIFSAYQTVNGIKSVLATELKAIHLGLSLASSQSLHYI